MKNIFGEIVRTIAISCVISFILTLSLAYEYGNWIQNINLRVYDNTNDILKLKYPD